MRLLSLVFGLLIWSSAVAEAAETPIIRPSGQRQPYQYEPSRASAQTGYSAQPAYEEPQVPKKGEILPPTRPERTRSEGENREYQPWEYERTDDSMVRDLQQSIDESFLEGRIRLNPLSPKRIKEIQRDSIAVEEARQMPVPEKGVSRFKGLSLQPGAAIQDVYLFPGNTTILRFMDNTGAPWPILSYVLGNSQCFTIQRAGGGSDLASNILIITPTKTFADTSLAVTLAPDVPTVLMLHASVKNVRPDYLVTFRTDAPGPQAAQAAYREEKNAFVSDVMLSFLDGIPPKGAKRMKSEKSLQAWEYQNKCYLRTDKSLIWPAYSSIVRSQGAHDMRVYELPRVSSVVLSIGGSPHRMRLGSAHEMNEYEQNLKDQHRKDMER